MPEKDLKAKLADIRASAKHGDVRAAVVELVDMLDAAADAGAKLAAMDPQAAAEAAAYAARALSAGTGAEG